MRQQEKQKKEVEKNKEDIQKEELEQLCSSETASISPAVIPENYLDRAILKKFRYELDIFEDYLGMDGRKNLWVKIIL